MTDRQDQKVAAGSTAIQSARDTTINHGLGPDEIRAIVDGLADHLPRMAAVATAVVEERLKSFKEEVIGHFDKDATTNRRAFEDPDFVETVADAQRGYARTGKSDAQKTLIDLIGERSKHDSGNRLSFTLNEAVTVAAKLTKNELSELALSFLVRQVKIAGINNIEKMGWYHQIVFSEILDDVEVEQASYNYLTAQRCATISMGEISLLDCWRQSYPGIFMKGLPKEQYESLAGDAINDTSLFGKSLFDGQGLQLMVMDKVTFDQSFSKLEISNEIKEQIWNQAINNLGDNDQIIQRMNQSCPMLKQAIDKWDSSMMKHLDLTAVGTAIGYTKMSQISVFAKSNINIWVN